MLHIVNDGGGVLEDDEEVLTLKALLRFNTIRISVSFYRSGVQAFRTLTK